MSRSKFTRLFARFATTAAPQAPKKSSSLLLPIAAVFAVGTGATYYYYPSLFIKEGIQSADYYKKVAKDIADLLESNPEHDDGSYGPLFVRLAWHASGTFDKKTNTGGSNGSTMRFPPESTDGANAGLGIARDVLAPLKKKYPGITFADLWTLAGVVAIKEMGGPTIPWRPGRADHVDAALVPPNGRLPDATKKADHLRNVFYRMGFNDQEIVALSGAHALGRCHTDRSGFTGPWTFSPTTFSNTYFKLLLEEKWTQKKWDGPKQFEDKTKQLMMLISDLSLVEDPEFKKYVVAYAKDDALFFKDFSNAFSKLLELGVPFPKETFVLSV